MKKLLSLTLIGMASLAATSASAADCERGTLDKKFCDANGDMVADAPTDPKQWIDPATLIFAYTPVEDPEVYRGVWDEFLRHMEKTTGKKVQFFPVQSNAAQLEAMRAGRLHVAGFNTGSNPLAVNCAGFVPFTMMASKQGAYGYEMEIIVPADSSAKKIEDLKGKTIAFTSQTSNSGYKAPSALLASAYGMQADKDYKTAFSGKHDNSVIGVANKDYDAAAVANSVMNRMIARKAVDDSKIRSIYKSQSFPTTGYGYVYNLKPELAEKVRQAFFTFNWEGTQLLKEFGKAEPAQEAFIPITYKEHWAVVREIDQAMKVAYTCQ
ncbi:phosphonate ABC transporter substrate-binding protein [Bordetella genomosp. 5]|uniref:phosphate/phosphite/phosphonate ABC transporter substrate-binding protein n=1 Tax=Bordetella genomosp. 5 TaxID=1395608 RepID=UPI000B9E2F46|nr:phosphate/phosphite/phosphonate ABC transporter substrate-binding protein [Bordetella genomosp. 5]OZI39605.1 phosphonate ABC transporter substrate-binding protein [Bordetella genomosp. 5]